MIQMQGLATEPALHTMDIRSCSKRNNVICCNYYIATNFI